MQRIPSVLAAVVALVLAGCAGVPTVTPTPTPTPQVVAARAGAAMQALESLHFSLQQSGAPAYVDADQSLVFRRAEGDFESPARMRATVKLMAASLVVEVHTVALDEEQWVTNILTGQWEKLPVGWGLNPAAFFDPDAGIPYLMTHGLISEQTEMEGLVTLEGLDGRFWHLSGEVERSLVDAMSGGLIPPGRVLLEAWIDPTTYLIHRVRLLLPESDPEEPTDWVIEFGAFDEPVEIEPPE